MWSHSAWEKERERESENITETEKERKSHISENCTHESKGSSVAAKMLCVLCEIYRIPAPILCWKIDLYGKTETPVFIDSSVCAWRTQRSNHRKLLKLFGSSYIHLTICLLYHSVLLLVLSPLMLLLLLFLLLLDHFCRNKMYMCLG